MAHQPESASAPRTPIVVVQPRDPGMFNGTDGIDVEEWLTLYERVSDSNHWDLTVMLANVVFYLSGTAKLWYDNHEADFGSWDTFKQKLRDLFGNASSRKIIAKQQLSTRAQTSTESYLSYIQDVLALCRKADSNMPESDKVGHVLKGIADDAFNLLMCRNCATVDAMIEECQRFEQAKSRRIERPFARLPNTAATSSCEERPPSNLSPPSAELTRIVRREIEAMAPASLFTNSNAGDSSTPAVSLVQAIVRNELANLGVHAACAVVSPTSASGAPTSFPRYPRFAPRSRNPADWRTEDDRPICFHCRRVGHVARYCHNRWSFPQRTPSFGHARRLDRSPFEPLSAAHPYNPDAATTWSSRSPSPRGHQSRSQPYRRPSSRSPPPRRAPSPSNRGSFTPEN